MKKKLLVLGGTSISRQIVYAAHEMGMAVYVTDYNEDSPAKAIADKSFMVSATDVDAVVDLIKEEGIDGVITGYADVLLPSYIQISHKANIPCYANLEAIKITTDKDLLKNQCRKYSVPVVEEYTLKDVEEGKATFPLLVKPVDNSGARGIYICHNEEEFKTYYAESLSFSPSKHVLIERFMQGKEATIFYYMHQGEIYLLGIADRHMLKFDDKLLQLPVGYTFPSKDIAIFEKEEDGNLRRMFRDMHMDEGMVFVQTFVNPNGYVVYEMGYRLTGSIEQHLMEKQYGFNHLKAILDFAVGNEVDLTKVKSLNPHDCNMANVTLLLNKGTIASYDGIDKVMSLPGVCHVHTSYPEGTVIDDSKMGRLAQVGVRVLMTATGHEDLLAKMDVVKDSIHVLSDSGEDMVIRNYSYKEICR